MSSTDSSGINQTDEYYFPQQHVIVAYENDAFSNLSRFAGIFLTYADETFTRDELLSYFDETTPDYLIAAEVPDIENITMNNYHSKLSSMIEELVENNLADIKVRYYIPRTLH